MSFVCFISTKMQNKYDFNKKYFVQTKKLFTNRSILVFEKMQLTTQGNQTETIVQF